MFARFARIGVGHQIQYVLPIATDDEDFIGRLSNDDEPLDEGDLEPTTSSTVESRINEHQNRAQGEITDDEEDSGSDAWDDEDEDTSMSDEDDEDEDTSMSDEDNEDEDTFMSDSDDEGPDFKF
ncbi:uncharacterized protein F5147DRAFT_658538 [Suillus discolor]|uniref:Uncharacterized protein n=1 Tax=Suillus discolor TaxID=1912936 RepID=A0A9P7ESW8_9AGAM|nr:uncharacterized protein F5147DRAFT_658538 [Suillus discolor]KAG2088917.1 hypothetical protein F5147DRAFT_658538 [Suillus discolor]